LGLANAKIVMPENVRALIFVLALAAPAFYIGRQIADPLIAQREFAVWRNAWIAATLAAFLSGRYFFVFAAVLTTICLYARSVRAATVALFFILLFSAPLVDVTIEGFGIVNKLFEINNARLIAIVLLLPILFTAGGFGQRNQSATTMPDRLVVGYVLLTIALEFNQSDFTNVMRVATLRILDVLVPYFACSRTVTRMADFRKVMLAFVIALLPLSLMAVLEVTKGWLLYSSIVDDWGGPLSYVRREGMVRATGSTGGGIILGFIIMVAIGCVLAIWQKAIQWRRFGRVVLAILAAGLIASLSRGPWVGVMVLVIAYLATGPNAVANLARFTGILAVLVVPVLLTPAGSQLINLLPFIGSVDAQNVIYRQRLIDSAFAVIERNPWLGSVDYLSTPEMQEMLQGEGIIDIVNTYLRVALNSGLVGLSLFLCFFAAILIGLRRVAKFGVVKGENFSAYARALIATLIAILVTIGTVSSTDFVPYVYWSFSGLCVALIRIAFRERAAVMARVDFASQIPV
jgi:O-antigen ligase